MKTLTAYSELEEKCKSLGLSITFETDYAERWEEQIVMGFDSLAPTIYCVDIVISGWT